MSSSQEFVPPSPSCFTPSATSRSSSPAVVGDLHRLRTLVSTTKAQDRLKAARVASFLGWRELELAARGCEGVPVEALPRRWGERAVTGLRGWDERNAGRRELDFSRRVAERRVAIQARGHSAPALTSSAFFGCSSVNEGTVHGSDILTRPRSPRSLSSDSDASSLHHSVDPTTPRCVQSALPPLSSNESSRGSRSADEEAEALREKAASYFALPRDLERQGSAGRVAVAGAGVDPFHLPSLLQLVGLNLRLALLPGSAGEGELGSRAKSRGGQVGWLGRGVVLIGVFIGKWVAWVGWFAGRPG